MFVTGQAPITLEWKIALRGEIKQKVIECLRAKKRPIRFLKIVPTGVFSVILRKNKLPKPQRSTIHNIF